jgi:hypothetical protein
VAETTPKGGLGVVSATPLAPWGWPSHPLVPKGFGGGFGHPLGPMGAAEPPHGAQGGGRSSSFSFPFFFFKKKIIIIK